MNINGYHKNNICCNYKKCPCQSKKQFKCNNSPLNSLFEVENFLCNMKKVIKCINFYKFFK